MSDPVPYTDDEAREARMWSNKHGPSNAWTAGNGTAARMIGRLLDERERLVETVTAMRSESDYMRSWKEAMNFWEGIAKDHGADRDMFAAAAMTGLLASDPGLSAPDIRRMSFNWADAMLRERANHIADASKMVETANETDFRPSKKACMDACQFASAVMTWISKATGAIDNCDRVSTADKEHVNSARDEVAKRYSKLMYGGPPDHDAAPAAKAEPESVGTDKAEPLMGQGTGDMHEPVAWLITTHEKSTGVAYQHVTAMKENADASSEMGRIVVPLYRSPTITTRERTALRCAISVISEMKWTSSITFDELLLILRGLLERLG